MTGRKPLHMGAVDIIDATLDQPKINGAMAQMRADGQELALVQAQHESAVRAVALQLGYQLPADCTDPDLIQRDISANMRRSLEACLEMGRGLAVLKTACGHGNFTARLDVLGIDIYVASKFISAAKKFSNLRPDTNLTKAIGNQSKLFEMLVLDDGQIEELELTGETGDLKLDEIATMSKIELRKALREAKAEAKANQDILDNKNAKIDQLNRKLNRQTVAITDWPAEFKGFITQVQHAHKEMKVHIGALDIVREKAMAIEPASPEEEAALNRAREMLANELLKIHSSCAECLEAMGHTFEKTLGAFATGEV